MAEPELMPSTELESMRRIDLESIPRIELKSMRSVELEAMPSEELESISNAELESMGSPVGLPNEAIMMMAGACLVGWFLWSISSRFRAKISATRRDPRDGRIRSLEAELRTALADAEKKRNTIETVEKERADARADTEKPDDVISDQQERIVRLTKNLRDEIRKTRELRLELADRATENRRSEVKLRELEKELGVAQASTNLIASGVLDYSLAAVTKGDRDLRE